MAINSHAQIVLSEDFGAGSNPGSALPSGITTYTYNGSASGAWPDVVNDGQYTVGTNTQLASNVWADIADHTSNNGTGYMMIVNATEGLTDEFFRKTAVLSANTNYEFTAFLINANSQGDYDYCTNNQGGLILPNVKFTIETLSGTVLATTSTGDIPFTAPPVWGEHKLNFTTDPTTASVQLVLTNLAPGGCGNDLALDDISFRVQITMDASDDTATVADATSGATNVINVLDNDQMDGSPISTFVLSLATGETLPSTLTFDTATGQIGVTTGAPTGIYSFDYQVCETVLAYNCSTATVSIDVTTPSSGGGGGGSGGGTCPIGQEVVSQTGYALTAELYDSTPQPKAEGAPSPEGTTASSSTNSATLSSNYIELDLTGTDAQIIPAGTGIILSLSSAYNTYGRAEILTSIDGNSFTSLGTIGNNGTLAGTWSSNILRHDTVTVPSSGARYIRINKQAGWIRVDGVIYSEICQDIPDPILNVLKVNTMYDPAAEGLYAVPGNDVIYTITVSNSGEGSVDAGSMFLADALPDEVAFYNGDMDDSGVLTTDPVAWSQSGTSMNLSYNADVGYSNASSAPASFVDCNYTPSAGYDSAISFVCFNPQGGMPAGSPAPEWSVSFRVRIK